MKIIFSIIINACILLLVVFLLGPSGHIGLSAGVTLGCGDCSIFSLNAWKIYLVGGIILGVMNMTIRPILKLLSLPFFFLFFGLTIFIVNGIVLKIFTFIMNDLLQIPGVMYTIDGWINFVIAVAIFTLLNMLYGLLFSK